MPIWQSGGVTRRLSKSAPVTSTNEPDYERKQEAKREMLLGFHWTATCAGRQTGMKSIQQLVTINKQSDVTMANMNQESSETIKGHRVFRVGDTVQIVSGPFQAFTGRIEGIN
jgi:transcription antitermination factor NusG